MGYVRQDDGLHTRQQFAGQGRHTVPVMGPAVRGHEQQDRHVRAPQPTDAAR